ncbi:B12-binding domain-containing radical SAM protein [Candidatus Dependentiae bacterium]|nr:B12-binding domain-containing radical SAM protein [Candidatus Dependentiae bacterium]
MKKINDIPIKLLLLLPADAIHRFKVGNFKKSLRYAPLTLTYLAALIPDDINVDLRILDEGVESLSSLQFEPDLVGMSVMTGTAPRAYYLSEKFREKGAKVVLGGVHPTLLPDEAKKYGDSVVVGFGERSFPQLLYDFLRNDLKQTYIDTEDLPYDKIPIPRRDLLNRRNYITVNTMMATRGCPNNCKFCAVPHVWKHHFFRRPIPDIINEIQQFKDKKVIFIDVNLLEDDDYTRRLLKALLDLKLKWVGLSNTKPLFNPEVFSLIVKSGCKGLLIGFESIMEGSLSGINKKFSNVNKYTELLKKLHDNGIRVNGTFLFGTDNDTLDIFEKTVEFVDRVKIDLPRYSVFTPYPGTPVFRELESQGRILEYNWAMYDVEHVVFKPKNMTPEELQEGLHWAWNQTYRTGSIFRRLSGTFSIFHYMLFANFGYKFYAKKLPGYTREVMLEGGMI